MKTELMNKVLKGLIRGYQLFISPVLGSRCRFYPTCSSYALEAIDEHGALRGLYLTLRRLLRCHPFHPGGIDLVPPGRGSRPCPGHHDHRGPPG